ncbi:MULTISPECIES: DUF4230 domain-containing protein [unclassified Moraxella]|uniref:DUF4230 domain-containing protein n=1 Tax=unclassified Moraxella TaxID=2685852 RepID=UPI002B40EA57|nr:MULTISPECIES: DUF4230 domain-containing protein [unclassified Moraxella]
MATGSQFSFFRAVLLMVLLMAIGIFGKVLYDKSNTSQVQAITREGVITDIQKLARLQSVAFGVDTIITANKVGTWQKLWQDKQKGLFVAHGRVLAGVDLSKLTPEMVQVIQKQDVNDEPVTHITISVPPSEVFEVYLDDLGVYDWQTGLFGMADNDPKILSEAQASAKIEVLKKACQGGIMTMAASNAAEQIKGLFVLTGATVDVVSQGAGACQLVR